MHGDPAFISIGAGFGIECDRNIAGSNIWYNIKKYSLRSKNGNKKFRKTYR